MEELSMPDEFQLEAERMLRVARRDLKAASAMTDCGMFDEPSWGFHIQQASEKALKAWISSLKRDYPFTHDLAVLRRLIIDFGADASPFQALDQFSPFAAQLRYDDDPEPLNLDRTHWNQVCSALINHVGKFVC